MAWLSRGVQVLLLLLAVCVLVQHIEAVNEADDTRPQRRNRNRNRNNRTRNRGRTRAGRGRGAARGNQRNRDPACEEIQVPMCKGLVGYTATRLPNRFNHTTQLEVYRVLEHMWALIDRGCSHNFRLLACSLFLPKCAGRRPPLEPCAKTCQHTKRKCESRLETFGYTWPQQLDCDALPKRRCLKKEKDNACTQDYTLCEPVDLPMCTELGVATGMSPNMFGQCNRTEISMEMEQYRPLVTSGCSPNLNLFLCGVYMPFCTDTESMLAFPCRELCEEVRDSCRAEYSTSSGGLPWPNKFQCHRYPESTNGNYTCVMPQEGGGYRLSGTS